MKWRVFNGNVLKLLAAVTMLVDHVGVLFFPNDIVFRIIGRISMPLFAFFIAEGCRYTRDRARHFWLIAALGVIFTLFYLLAEGRIYFTVFTSFSISVLMIYALQEVQRQVMGGRFGIELICSALALLALGYFAYCLSTVDELFGKEAYFDYGFFGCLLPVFASLFDVRRASEKPLPFDDLYYVRWLSFGVGALVMCISLNVSVSYYSLLALVPLFFYNGKRGKLNLKYFFYVFYPAHLVILYGIQMLL